MLALNQRQDVQTTFAVSYLRAILVASCLRVILTRSQGPKLAGSAPACLPSCPAGYATSGIAKGRVM